MAHLSKVRLSLPKAKRYAEHIGQTITNTDMPVAKWCLDYPSTIHEPHYENGSRVVQGWVLLKPTMSQALSQVRIVCDLQPTFELCFPLNVNRPDVLQNMLPDASGNDQQLMCGFRFLVPLNLTLLRLSLELNDKRWLLKQLNLEPNGLCSSAMKVLVGNEGWFFLDNDTNFSVDQHTGNIRLTDKGIADWSEYAQVIRQGYHGLQSPVMFLVAPTKESVMSEYHPKRVARQSILQPVFNLLPSEQLIYPVSELHNTLGDGAFYKTDTHWTHQGASLVSALLAKRLGLPANKVDDLLTQDRYVSREITGDLGNKFNPNISSQSLFLASFQFRKWVVYDNGLPNFGRVIVTHYEDALEDSTCLIFGSSSSYSMLNYLCRFFKHLVFIHTAGSIDQTLVDSVSPTYLVAQTNARFMIRPPEANYLLSSAIAQKQSNLDEVGLEHQSKNRNLAGINLIEKLGLLPWHQHISVFDEKPHN